MDTDTGGAMEKTEVDDRGRTRLSMYANRPSLPRLLDGPLGHWANALHPQLLQVRGGSHIRRLHRGGEGAEAVEGAYFYVIP